MKRTLLLVLLVLLCLVAAPASADGSGCFGEMGGYHVPALLNASPDELSKQARCMILEYSITPKAMLLPPSALGPVARGRTQLLVERSAEGEPILRVGAAPVRPPRSVEEAGRAGSFGLGDPGTAFRPER